MVVKAVKVSLLCAGATHSFDTFYFAKKTRTNSSPAHTLVIVIN